MREESPERIRTANYVTLKVSAIFVPDCGASRAHAELAMAVLALNVRLAL
jgi:hypothetical protein